MGKHLHMHAEHELRVGFSMGDENVSIPLAKISLQEGSVFAGLQKMIEWASVWMARKKGFPSGK